METRKIQKSGTTYYLYLPASWCREHKITTESIVYLDKSSKGDLVVQPKKSETSLSSLKFELNDISKEVINKIIIASYINPVKDFHISLKQSISPDQILEHKKLLGGLELVDFDENSINCQTSLSLSDPDTLLKTMIMKILSIAGLMKKDPKHELIKRYEEEIDKSNLLIHKSIITNLMYRKESKLRHIDLFYLGLISRNLEQITDILITLEDNNKLIDTIESMMKSLVKIIEHPTQSGVISFIKSVEKLGNVEVKNLETYKKKRIYSLLGHVSETLCDRLITNIVDI
jgi:phosphate uptake regulator